MRFAPSLLLVMACASLSAPALVEDPLPAKYRLKFSVIDQPGTPDVDSRPEDKKVIASGEKEFSGKYLHRKALKKTDDPYDLVPDYQLYFEKSKTHTEGYTIGGLLATCVRDGRKELSLHVYDAFPTQEESTKRKPMSLQFNAKSEGTPALSAVIMLSYDAEKKLKRTLELEVEPLPDKTPR